MSWQVRGNQAVVCTSKTNSGEYRDGVVRTPHGFAWVAESTESDGGRTHVRFIYGGREHEMTWRRTFTDRGLGAVVGRWVWGVVRSGILAEKTR